MQIPVKYCCISVTCIFCVNFKRGRKACNCWAGKHCYRAGDYFPWYCWIYIRGTARFESFQKISTRNVKMLYNMGIKYYFPELLSSIFIKRKEPVKFDQISHILGFVTAFSVREKMHEISLKIKYKTSLFRTNS